jgi:uncharacterized protein (DUF2336 family)
MDLSFLDKSSNVTPLLVRLYDSHKLYGLAKDKKPLARAELTSAVSELLEMELSEKEKDLIADVMIELLRQAEIELRQALSEKLSAMDSVPLRLVLQLANDEIIVADPVLRSSPVLGDLDLIYIIKSKGPEYWQAIAARSNLSDQVVNVLADARDFDTAITLAENAGITINEHALVVLSDLAQESEVLARPLLRREEVSSEIASKLYEFVSAELKKFIRENYEVDSATLIESVDELVLELSEASEEKSEFMPSASVLKAAQRYKDKGLLTTKLMIGTLRRGQIQSFVAQFAQFTGLDIDTIETILSQANGQGLAVACKALGISKQDFISVFLLTNRVRNKGRMVDLKEMTRATSYYNRIKLEVAKGIMENSLSIEQSSAQDD